jgi:hypothetical protein
MYFVALAFFAMHEGSANAISVTTQFGQGADAQVVSNPAYYNNNYGSLDIVAIKDDSGTGFLNRKGYFRFDLSGISGAVENATFRFIYAGYSDGKVAATYNVFGLLDGNAGEGWGESSITWNNAPGNNTGSGSGMLPSQTTLLGTFYMSTTLSPGDAVSFSSTGLRDFLAADTNDLVTLIITRQEQNLYNEWIASKENTSYDPPLLDVTLGSTPVSEPATLLFVAFGLIALVGCERKFKGVNL